MAEQSLVLVDETGRERVRINAQDGEIVVLNDAGGNALRFHGDSGDLYVGGKEASGDIVVQDEAGQGRVVLSAGQAAHGRPFVSVADRVAINGTHAQITAGGHDEAGTIVLRGEDGLDQVRIETKHLRTDVLLYSFHAPKADREDPAKATVHLDGQAGAVRVGGGSQADGIVTVRGYSGEDRIVLRAGSNTNEAQAWLGGNGASGDLRLFPIDATQSADETIRLDGQEGKIHVSGDIVFRNADGAEEFDIAPGEHLDPGCVVIIDDDGRLRASAGEYDARVAGVVSGAGRYRPGLILDRQGEGANRMPVSLFGKVCCRVDARTRPVRAGDALTTSGTEGCAMVAVDRSRLAGALLGKALAPLAGGIDLVPILVGLG